MPPKYINKYIYIYIYLYTKYIYIYMCFFPARAESFGVSAQIGSGVILGGVPRGYSFHCEPWDPIH